MTQKQAITPQEIIFNIVLGLLFALGIFDVLYSFTGAYAHLGLLYTAAHVFLNIILFLALSFIGSKEKWALWLFLGVIFAHIGLDVYVQAFDYLKLLLIVPFIYFWVKLK
jgi:hypothetical protein